MTSNIICSLFIHIITFKLYLAKVGIHLFLMFTYQPLGLIALLNCDLFEINLNSKRVQVETQTPKIITSITTWMTVEVQKNI